MVRPPDISNTPPVSVLSLALLMKSNVNFTLAPSPAVTTPPFMLSNRISNLTVLVTTISPPMFDHTGITQPIMASSSVIVLPFIEFFIETYA
jgi:hypothetical protein